MPERSLLVDEALRCALGIEGGPLAVTTIKGDASSRSYHRISLEGHEPRTAVLMELGTDPLRSDEFTNWAAPEYPFLLVQEFLARGGLPVPRIYGARPEHGWLLIEDLGDTTLEARLDGLAAAEREAWYRRAVDLLARWQSWWREAGPQNPVAGRVFSRRLMAWEIDHYIEWGLEARLGVRLDPGERTAIAGACAPLLDAIERIPVALVHRDFQSRNLMVRGDDLSIIDFQDALMGPVVYDAVALLNDSYVDVPPRLEEAMLERLRRAVDPGGDPASWRRWFDLVAVQRKLKDAGRFVFIDRVKGNPSFLPFVPRSLDYVRRSIGRLSEIDALREALERRGGLDAV